MPNAFKIAASSQTKKFKAPKESKPRGMAGKLRLHAKRMREIELHEGRPELIEQAAKHIEAYRMVLRACAPHMDAYAVSETAIKEVAEANRALKAALKL